MFIPGITDTQDLPVPSQIDNDVIIRSPVGGGAEFPQRLPNLQPCGIQAHYLNVPITQIPGKQVNHAL